jgi:hypothetical protein
VSHWRGGTYSAKLHVLHPDVPHIEGALVRLRHQLLDPAEPPIQLLDPYRDRAGRTLS